MRFFLYQEHFVINLQKIFKIFKQIYNAQKCRKFGNNSTAWCSIVIRIFYFSPVEIGQTVYLPSSDLFVEKITITPQWLFTDLLIKRSISYIFKENDFIVLLFAI